MENVNKKLFEIEETLKEGMKATVTKIEETNSKDYYGENAIYKDRNGIKLTIKSNESDLEITQFFAYPEPTGYYKSNIYFLRKRYGDIKEKMQVILKIDENGFWKIDF